ncbi:hypothetical protein GQ53DRAFT_381578 [Thozetella sp. PMI_491]|nr:hypothetical protein GQ53DRAFT_381578 [Thozetella sp. PMI_491]
MTVSHGLLAAPRLESPWSNSASYDIAMSVVTIDNEDLDLSLYEPPSVLGELPEIDSETILDVVHSSLEHIRQQVALEKQQREALEEALAAQHATEAEATRGKGKALETPASIPAIVLPPLLSKPPRHSRFGFRRMLHHLRDKSGDFGPESSAVAAARSRPEDAATSSSLARLVYKHIRTSPSSEDVSEQVECVSCLEDISPKDGVKTTCHYYCKECFQQLITVALEHEEQWPPKCCLNKIPQRIIVKSITKELLKQYREKAEEFEIPIDKRLYCCQPDCGEWMRKVDRATKTARCSKGHVMCVMCRQAAHPQDEECPEDHDRQMADRLAQDEGWRRCISCKILVEHREACQHMTCRCGSEFCYVCGARWRTCSCSMEQLNQVKNGAAARRAERQQREQEEEAWLQDALRAIEAAQREQERQDELRRVELAYRREAKYNAMRNALLQLNHLQELTMLEDQARVAVEDNKAAIERRENLTRTHANEREELRAETDAKIATEELEWERGLRERALWSRQLEDEYGAAQKAFWGQFKGGETRLRQVLAEYQRETYDRYQRWCKWRDSEMEHFRWKLEDELGIREEMLDTTLQRFEDGLVDEMAERDKKHRAEQRWFQLVAAERIRLLSEIELVEREAGLDEEVDIGTAMSI